MLSRAVELRTISDEELLYTQTRMGTASPGDFCLVRSDAREDTDYILLYYDGHGLSRRATIFRENIEMFLQVHVCVKKFGIFDEGHYRLSPHYPINR